MLLRALPQHCHGTGWNSTGACVKSVCQRFIHHSSRVLLVLSAACSGSGRAIITQFTQLWRGHCGHQGQALGLEDVLNASAVKQCCSYGASKELWQQRPCLAAAEDAFHPVKHHIQAQVKGRGHITHLAAPATALEGERHALELLSPIHSTKPSLDGCCSEALYHKFLPFNRLLQRRL